MLIIIQERNYEDDDEKDESAAAKTEKEEEPIAEPLISKPLQDLMKLIFNTALMQQSMESLSYDSKKMPLGKLSKTTILRGYEILKMIAEVITDPATAPAKYNEYGYNTREILSQLSSRYYVSPLYRASLLEITNMLLQTLIPHSFGRYTPPSIDTPQTLKRETELVENLIDMKISNEIIQKSITNTSNVNPIDLQYQSLGLNEAVALDKKSSEFKHLSAYVKKTHGKTHHMTLNVQEIFRVTRSVEEERWEAAGWDKFASDNRKLLWHGSRTTNYGGILSQGLRIAPPEAPVSGYMFDKGIYLADIVSKSANYCCASVR